MKSLERLKILHFPKWVPEISCGSSKPNLYADESHGYLQHRLCRTSTAVDLKNGVNLGEVAKKSRVIRTEVQAALLDYFHITRGLQIMDADHMSKNTPEFFDSFAKRLDIDGKDDVGRTVTRFLRYHPVYEFEPFFESIGLKPFEYASFLPKNMMFLDEDPLLLNNYYVLSRYGVPRNKIGRIYKEVTEVFKYECGILQAKLQSLEDLGLKRGVVAKIVASTPQILLNREFIEAIAKLKAAGIEHCWLEENLSVEDFYNWKSMLELIYLFSHCGLSKEQIGELLNKHPSLLLDRSGDTTVRLFAFLLKFGSTPSDLQNALLQFPRIPVQKFTNNLHESYKFLTDINMAAKDIGWIVRSHLTILGSCRLKKANSLLILLNCGEKTLRQMIKNNPYVLTRWALRMRVKPLQEEKRSLRVKMIKTQFLLSMGFVEKSKEMEKAFRSLRGKVEELQERFDSLVNSGVSHEEAMKMVKIFPQILNQSSDIIKTKIRIYVNDLGLQVSDFVAYPRLFSFTIERVKLRFSMYNWLKEQAASPKLLMSTLLITSDEQFMKDYVNCYRGGLQHWENLQQEIYSDGNR